MPLCFDISLDRVSRASDANSLEIGLVNNMPDSAFEATERQFRSLLDQASGDLDVRLTRFSLPNVRRSGDGMRHLRAYAGIDDLWDRRLDGLIVTGTEPHAADLRDEPYWGSLTRLLDWAERNTTSTIWSCLAAHAAVLHNDGIRRRRLQEKRFGVFEFNRIADHELSAGVASSSRVPHSRWNDLPESELETAGYTVLARSEAAGVDTFVKKGRSLHVFFQGHPEYDADTLLLEYRRDIKRFLRSERDTYPTPPHGYFEDESFKAWERLRQAALKDRHESLMARFSASPLLESVKHTWRPQALQTYRNWLGYLVGEKCRLEKVRSVVGAGQ